MTSRFIQNLLAFLAVVLAITTTSFGETNRDVLAHSAGDWAWFAQVSAAKTSGSMEALVSGEETVILVHHNIPGEPWRPLPTLPGRAVALASRMSQLVVLMNDGEWLTLWEDGSATGQPLPGQGRMKAIADDGNDLWALGEVNGGIATARAAILREIASTMPTTSGSLTPPIASTEPAPSLTPALVLFRQINGRWAAVSELPFPVIGEASEYLSLTIVNGIPLVCHRTPDFQFETLRGLPGRNWESIATVKPATTQPANFSLMTDGFKPLLWITPGNVPGELFADLDHGGVASVKLQWPGKVALNGIPAATFAGNYLCIFGPNDDKVLEQRYKATGEVFGTPSELTVTDSSEGMLPHWLEALLLGFMGFSVGVRVFRQWSSDDEDEKAPAEDSPAPAPLLARFIAGLIDAVPVLAAVGFVLWRNNHGEDHDLSAIRVFTIIASAVGIYILHTTLTEAFTGRTAGKWIMGLKVVATNGNPPTKAQCVSRNLLRIVDPLVMVLVTPLRQRDADTLVNTMVVLASAKPQNSVTESDQGELR